MVSASLSEALAAHRPPLWVNELAAIVGPAHVLTSPPDLWVHARDRAPLATFQVRRGRVPATLPSAVVCPATVDELCRVVSFTRERRIPWLPYGAGSGVLGGAWPLACELVVDVKRMNRILALDPVDGTVTVQAGMNGGQFEAALNARGYTCGHLPQSLHMSTVGGWAACRGAGQSSTRYGKIEDIVLGLSAVLPDGRTLEVRPVARRAVGPSVKDLFIGSEGVFGVLTELTLRIWPLPQARVGAVLAFARLQDGWDALRAMMQAELRPAVVRLYDVEESAQRTQGLATFRDRPVLAILEFSGAQRLVDVERELALELAGRHGGVVAEDAPYRHWLGVRYVSYSPQWQANDHYMDTIEITLPWSRLPAVYERIRCEVLALGDGLHFGAHWSHVYPEGACQYMTVRIPPMSEDRALHLHAQAWDICERLCLEGGGSVSHHHGVGLLRAPWLRRELGSGLALLQAVKDHLDPDNLLLAGRMGLRPPPGVAAPQAVLEGLR